MACACVCKPRRKKEGEGRRKKGLYCDEHGLWWVYINCEWMNGVLEVGLAWLRGLGVARTCWLSIISCGVPCLSLHVLFYRAIVQIVYLSGFDQAFMYSKSRWDTLRLRQFMWLIRRIIGMSVCSKLSSITSDWTLYPSERTRILYCKLSRCLLQLIKSETSRPLPSDEVSCHWRYLFDGRFVASVAGICRDVNLDEASNISCSAIGETEGVQGRKLLMVI